MTTRYRYMDFRAPHPRNIEYMSICALCDWPLADENMGDHMKAKHDIGIYEIKVRVVRRSNFFYNPKTNRIEYVVPPSPFGLPNS